MGVKGNAVVTSFNDFSLIEKSVSHDWERFQDGGTALHSGGLSCRSHKASGILFIKLSSICPIRNQKVRIHQ